MASMVTSTGRACVIVLSLGLGEVANAAPLTDIGVHLRTDEQITTAASAHGFCQMQTASLERIKVRHPALAPRADLTKHRFDQMTGEACGAVEVAMEKALRDAGPDRWTTYQAQMLEAINTAGAASLAVLDDATAAEAFLKDVAARADGGLDPLIVQPLINASLVYRKNPVAQWPRWTRIWTSKGNPKSLGTHFRLRVPVAFTEKEPDLTTMLKKWVQELPLPGGHVMLGASVFPYPDGATLALLSEEFLTTDGAQLAKGMAEDLGGSAIEGRKLTLFDRPAILARYDARKAHMDFELVSRTSIVMGLLPEGIVSLTCSVTLKSENMDQLPAFADRYIPLCNQFFNSAAQVLD